MAESLYDILNVKKDAEQGDIKKAYRKLMKQLHPDLNPGDLVAEDRFKRVSSAYDIIGNADSRTRYDAGEIDETGAQKPQQQYYRQYADADAAHPYQSTAGYQDMGDINDLFAQMLRQRQQQAGGSGAQPYPGGDLHYHMQVSFTEAALGTKKQVQMADGANLAVTIPKGIEDGKTIRLRGKGQPGFNGGPNGDALITIDIAAHPLFTRSGLDIELTLPITIAEAALGDKVAVETLHGRVGVNIPAGSGNGKVLRLKGRGIENKRGAKGDQLITLSIEMPKTIDSDLADFLKDWKQKHPYDPRRKMKGAANA